MELTMTFYTDPVLLDVAGAVEALPDFSGEAAGMTGRGLKCRDAVAGKSSRQPTESSAAASFDRAGGETFDEAALHGEV
jgi:hypothetical protein